MLKTFLELTKKIEPSGYPREQLWSLDNSVNAQENGHNLEWHVLRDWLIGVLRKSVRPPNPSPPIRVGRKSDESMMWVITSGLVGIMVLSRRALYMGLGGR